MPSNNTPPNYMLNSIEKIRRSIEDVINQRLIKGIVPKDPVIYFLERVLYTDRKDYHRIYYHALISKNTTKIFDALSNYSLKDGNTYIYPISFEEINYFIEGQKTIGRIAVPFYTLYILIDRVYTYASIFDFAHHFVLYIINMIIVNRYKIDINEAITKAEDIIIKIGAERMQSIYKVVLASYYETTLFEAVFERGGFVVVMH